MSVNLLNIDPTLPQHHIDGLRFIYKQYHRKKPGIIVNNPEKYDNIQQTVLFLCSLNNTHSKLANAILIVCQEDNVQEWKKHFENQLISANDTVVVAATNPYIKKSIFINTLEGIFNFTRRTWSVMVVDHDDILKDKVLLNKFDAQYKIWITPLDIKKNLKTLAVIHKWIYPKEKFYLDYSQVKTGHLRDIISQAISLDTFLEDIVYKPLNKPSPIKVSLKNKDATGTKIKRSKRRLESVTTGNTNRDSGNSIGASVLKIAKNNDTNIFADISLPSSINNNNTSKMLSSDAGECTPVDNTHSEDDIENFIRNKKPIECDSLSDYLLEDEISTNKEKDKTKKEYIIISDSDDSAYELETQEFLEDNNETITDCQNNKTNEVCNVVANATHSTNIQPLNNTEHIDVTLSNHMDIDDKIGSVIPKQRNGVEKGNKSTQQTVDRELESDPSFEEVTELNGKNKTSEITNVAEVENIEIEESQAIKNENKRVDMDTKLTEHEDRIFKKFKGTFLDSIF